MVKFVTKLDQNTQMSLARQNKKGNIASSGIIIVMFTLLALITFAENNIIGGIIYLICGVFVSALIYFLQIYMNKKVAKSSTFLNNNVTQTLIINHNSVEYIQESDTGLYSLTRTPFQFLFKIVENNDLLLLYIASNQAIVVEKSGLVEGTLDEARTIFKQNLQDRFITPFEINNDVKEDIKEFDDESFYFCEKCGKKISLNDDYCQSCGAKINK